MNHLIFFLLISLLVLAGVVVTTVAIAVLVRVIRIWINHRNWKRHWDQKNGNADRPKYSEQSFMIGNEENSFWNNLIINQIVQIIVSCFINGITN